MKDDSIQKMIINASNSRATFLEIFKIKLNENDFTASLLKITCNEGHSLATCVRRVAVTISNIGSVNFINEQNGNIHESKKRQTTDFKKDLTAKKVKKLSSN